MPFAFAEKIDNSISATKVRPQNCLRHVVLSFSILCIGSKRQLHAGAGMHAAFSQMLS